MGVVVGPSRGSKRFCFLAKSGSANRAVASGQFKGTYQSPRKLAAVPLLVALLSWPASDSQPTWAQEAVVAAYAFDEGGAATVTDSSGYGNDGLVRGPSVTSGWYGGALGFDGNDYVAVPDSTSLDLVDELTLAAWVLPTALGGYRVVIDKTTSGRPCNYYLALLGDEVDFGFYEGRWRGHTTAGVNITVNTWYHLAAVYDGVARTVSIYVNGTEVLTEVETGSLMSNGEELRIGIGFPNEGFVGRIDEVRIFNRALLPGEVGEAMATPVSLPFSTTTNTTTTTSTSVPQATATTTTTTTTVVLGTATITTTTVTTTIPGGTATSTTIATGPPSLLGVVAALGFDRGGGMAVTDSSGYGNDGLARGTSWTSGWYGSALAFDGNDYVAIPDSTSLDLVDELTLAAWVLPTALGGYRVIIDKTTSGRPCNYYLALLGDEVDFGFYDARWRGHTTAGVNITVNTWYHLAAVYDGVARTVSVYVNGAEVLTEVETGSLMSNGEELRIGIGFPNEGFVGRIDEVRIFDRALSPGEVGEAMATPVALPFSTTTNTTTTTSTSVPQTTATTTTTTATPTTVTTTTATVTIPTSTSTTSTTLPVVPDAGYALRFFGSGTFGVDQVKISVDPQVPADVGVGDFSIEWWMRVNSFDVTAGTCIQGWVNWIQGNIVFDRDVFGNGDLGDYGISVFRDGLAFGVASASFANTVCGSTNVADGLWHHVAATRNESTGQLRIYVDGRLDAQGSGPRGNVSYRDGRPTQYPSSDPYLVIGAEKHFGPPAFSGWIDEIRISDTVRYAGNFTRPSTAFTPDGNTAALYHLNEGIGSTVNDSSNAPGGPSTGVIVLGGVPRGPIWVVSDAPIFAGLGN